MLERHSVSESSYTPSPRVAAVTAHCGWHKNTLEEATAVIQSIDDINEVVCEDEHAAAEVCKQLIEKVVREEQLQFIKTMVGKADDLEAKYKTQNKPKSYIDIQKYMLDNAVYFYDLSYYRISVYQHQESLLHQEFPFF